MRISKKSQYGLRAVFELAVRNSGQPVRVSEVAAAQNIPPRFLEVILNELRHAGFVESRRGNEGGYLLARGADELNVGEIIDFLEGPFLLAGDNNGNGNSSESYFGDLAFAQLWERVNMAATEIFRNTSFAELADIFTRYGQ
ncbi:MAG: RrF2 family transcriptional regulator [Planctomycetota bacterium]|jgi:Rrf2 family protein